MREYKKEYIKMEEVEFNGKTILVNKYLLNCLDEGKIQVLLEYTFENEDERLFFKEKLISS